MNIRNMSSHMRNLIFPPGLRGQNILQKTLHSKSFSIEVNQLSQPKEIEITDFTQTVSFVLDFLVWNTLSIPSTGSVQVGVSVSLLSVLKESNSHDNGLKVICGLERFALTIQN